MRSLLKREPGLLIVILVPLIMFGPEVLGLSRFAGVDHTKLNMPIKYFDVLAVRNGEVPLWNPYIATGAPHMAEGEPGTFYVLNLIDHLPGDFYYWYGINIILHFLIAGITCYALLRYKGAGKFSATIFAVLFQFAPFTMLHLAAVAMFQVLAWIPLLVLLFDMVLDGRRPAWNTFWGIALVFQMTCIGSAQLLSFAYLALIFLGISRAIGERSRRIVFRGATFLILTACGGALLAALQLLPTLAFKANSIRGVELWSGFHAHGTWLNLNRLTTLFLFPACDFKTLTNLEEAVGFGSSQIYIGLFPLLMVVLAVWDRDTRRRALPYLLAALILLLFAFGYNFPVYRWLTNFPPFSYFRFLGRTAVLFVLFSMVPASLAFDMLIRRKDGLGLTMRKAVISVAAVVLITFILFFTARQEAPGRALLILVLDIVLVTAFCFAAFRPGRAKAYLAVAIVLVQLFMLYPYARMLTQTTVGFKDTFLLMDKIAADDEVELKRVMNGFDPWVVDPDGLTDLQYSSREWIIDPMEGLAGTMRGVGCFHIYLPLYEMKWKELIFDRLLINLRNNPQDIEIKNRNICRVLGINYIAVESDYLDMPGFEPYEDEAVDFSYRETARMFRNSKPYPRFYLTRNVKRYRFVDKEGEAKGEWYFLNRQLYDAAPEEIAGVVIPDDRKPPLFDDREWEVRGEIKMARDGFNSYELDVTCERDCYLVVRDNYYPGWEVRVDGEPDKIYQADYVNRAVYLKQGQHKVEFIYRPEGFRKGLRISFVSLLVFILAGAIMKWGWKTQSL